MTNLRVFSGRSNLPLAEKISEYLGLPLGRAALINFPDSEVSLKLHEDVRGRDVFVIQSTCRSGAFSANDMLQELLIFIDCLRRASAQRITAVIPYFGYARQDRKDEGRVPITAKLVANLLTEAGANRVLTTDLHAAQIQGFFDIPVDNLSAEPVITSYFQTFTDEPIVLVSPDVGNIKRARVYAERLNGDLAIIDKRRKSGTEIVVQNIIGDVEGKTVLMVDDIIATAGTILKASELVDQHGAKRVIVAATHGVLCGPAVERLRDGPIDEVAITDTLPLPDGAAEGLGDKLTIWTISELLGEAIRRIHRNESVSSLFIA
jgi:ribose-phosphate pyrophosphokinase